MGNGRENLGLGRSRWMLLLFFVVSCSFTRVEPTLTPLPSPTTVRVIQTTAVPTLNRQLQVVKTSTIDPNAPTASPTENPENLAASAADETGACDLTREPTLTQYSIDAELDWRRQHLTIEQHVHYVNHTQTALDHIVFNVEPNRFPAVFTLDSLTYGDDSAVAGYELGGRRLHVDLITPIETGCGVDLKLNFQIQIPQIGAGLSGFGGYFGFGSRQINLGHWLPTIAIYFDDNWVVHLDASVGEQTVFDPADWDVKLNVTGARDTLMVAGPGTVMQPTPTTWHFMATRSRDFTLSLSEQFKLLTATTADGVDVELYHFSDAILSEAVNGAAHTLEMSVRSLEMYTKLFGAYPNKRFVVVQGDFPDGMEFNDIVFVSTTWFSQYTGDPRSYLTLITIHEVSHQWWYGRVGSDQATYPWLDETLATYSEYLFLEEHFPELREWWWRFRVDTFIPPDFGDRRVGGTVYEFSTVREYINVVYLRGARMLHDVRQVIGTDAFLTWLARYAEAGDGEIVTPDAFWDLLTDDQLEAVKDVRERYFGEVSAE